MPVFPLVGSTSTVLPAVILPAFSASLIIAYPVFVPTGSIPLDCGQRLQECEWAQSQRLRGSERRGAPMRSLTEEHGSIISSFAATSATQPSVTLLRNTIGVKPISCVTLSAAGKECRRKTPSGQHIVVGGWWTRFAAFQASGSEERLIDTGN